MLLEPGDWITPDGKPERYYPIKPEVFAMTYEAVEQEYPMKSLAVKVAALLGLSPNGWAVRLIVVLGDVFWYLTKRFGSKAWGGVEGAYRYGRWLREKEYQAWKRAQRKAVTDRRFGDLDDSGLAYAEGNMRFEIEDWHVKEHLQSAVSAIATGRLEEALAILRDQIDILEQGHPNPGVKADGGPERPAGFMNPDLEEKLNE